MKIIMATTITALTVPIAAITHRSIPTIVQGINSSQLGAHLRSSGPREPENPAVFSVLPENSQAIWFAKPGFVRFRFYSVQPGIFLAVLVEKLRFFPVPP